VAACHLGRYALSIGIPRDSRAGRMRSGCESRVDLVTCVVIPHTSVHSIRGIRRVSKRKSFLISADKARFRGLNTPTSRGCNRCEVYGGRQTRSMFLSRQKAINLAVRCDPCPSRSNSLRNPSFRRVSGSNKVVNYS
jgi:hypothetical protein